MFVLKSLAVSTTPPGRPRRGAGQGARTLHPRVIITRRRRDTLFIHTYKYYCKSVFMIVYRRIGRFIFFYYVHRDECDA